MKRTEIVAEGARSLVSTELALDAAYIEMAGLTGKLVQLRISGGLSAVVGQEALDEVTEAQAHLNRARSRLVSAHRKLDEVKTRLGCRTVATGGGDKDDPEKSAAPVLRQVA